MWRGRGVCKRCKQARYIVQSGRCSTCYRKFGSPEPEAEDRSCIACGNVFQARDARVWVCAACEDYKSPCATIRGPDSLMEFLVAFYREWVSGGGRKLFHGEAFWDARAEVIWWWRGRHHDACHPDHSPDAAPETRRVRCEVPDAGAVAGRARAG